MSWKLFLQIVLLMVIAATLLTAIKVGSHSYRMKCMSMMAPSATGMAQHHMMEKGAGKSPGMR